MLTVILLVIGGAALFALGAVTGLVAMLAYIAKGINW